MVTAYLIAIVDVGKEHEAAKAASAIKGVDEVLITYGAWDLVIKVTADTLNELDVTITKVREIPAIEMTETLIGT
jgi:DNA-binding Lrp family transcriptional regulator